MKTLLALAFAFALLLSPSAVAGLTVKLQIDPPAVETPAPEGYVLYQQTPTGWIEVKRFDATSTIFDVTVLGGGVYSLSAFNAGGESDRSNSVTIPGRPGTPTNLRLVIEFVN